MKIFIQALMYTSAMFKSFRPAFTSSKLHDFPHSVSFFMHLKAHDIMCANPKQIQATELAVVALKKMEEHNITQLLVMDEKKYLGIVHLHDILNEGII